MNRDEATPIVEALKDTITVRQWEALAAYFGPEVVLAMPSVGVLADNIRIAMATKNLTMRQVAMAATISYPYLAQIKAGKKEPSLAVLTRLEAVLGNLR